MLNYYIKTKLLKNIKYEYNSNENCYIWEIKNIKMNYLI